MLGAAFLADQGAVAFGEAGRRQHQVRLGGGGGLLVIGDDHHLGRRQGRVDTGGVGAAIEIVLQHHHGVGLSGGQSLERGFHGVAAEERQAEAIGFADHQADGTVLLALLEGFGDVRRGFDQCLVAQRVAGHYQRTLGRQQGIGDALGEGLGLRVEVGHGRGAWVDRVGHGEAEASEIVRRGVNGFLGHVVEAGRADAGDEQRVLRMLGDVLHRGVEPRLDLHVGGHLDGLALHRLAQGQGDAGGGLGQVLAEDEDRVVVLDVADARHRQRAFLHDLQDQAQAVELAFVDAAVEVAFANQLAQGEVAFQAGARRTDADHLALLQQGGGLVEGAVQAQLLLAQHQQRLARTVFAVDVAVAEATAVAEEVVVDRAVVAVLDAADLAVALAGADVAAAGAAVADARGELHVPLAVVALGVGLVGEHAGGADLGEVAGELAFQHAVLDPSEVDVVVGAVDAEVGAAGVVLVVAHAAVAGDAAVHLMGDERAEFLVLVGALGEAVPALVVAGHHRHVLQVAVTAFLAHRAVVRVVGHQPFDDAGAELLGLFVFDGDPGVVGGGVMQDMTRRPRLSFSSVYCFTAHWRQAPTLPSAGCQQK